MKPTVFLTACLLVLAPCAAQPLFQLAPPVMKYTSAFFTDRAVVRLQFRQPGAVIRYTLNGSAPNGSSTLYTGPIQITRNKTILTAKAFSQQYLPSAPVTSTFIKAGIPVASVNSSQPNGKYAAAGSASLIDNKGGIATLSARTWLGFQGDTIHIELALAKPVAVKEVLVDFLQDEGSWIFLPRQVALYYFNEKTAAFELYKKEDFLSDSPNPGARCYYAGMATGKDITTDRIKLQVMPLQHIPDWHDGKGQAAWLFIDEIKVY